MSTNVLESENGAASSICFSISPWQYRTESQGAITEPLIYGAPLGDANTAAAAIGQDERIVERSDTRTTEMVLENRRTVKLAEVKMTKTLHSDGVSEANPYDSKLDQATDQHQRHTPEVRKLHLLSGMMWPTPDSDQGIVVRRGGRKLMCLWCRRHACQNADLSQDCFMVWIFMSWPQDVAR